RMFIKATRVDAIYGAVGLMGDAFDAAELARVPLLVLYGARDEIVPPEPVQEFVARLPAGTRVVYYDKGCHMLMRGLDREVVLRDRRAGIGDHRAPREGAATFREVSKCRPPDWRDDS